MAKNLKNKKIKGDFVNGKIKESSLPDSINARISILGGTVEELKDVSFLNRELVINDDTGLLEYIDQYENRVPVNYDEKENPFTNFYEYLYTVWPITGDVWYKSAKFTFITPEVPSISVKTTTGYARAVRWDGTLSSVFGTGNPNNWINANFGTAPIAPYNTLSQKFVGIHPTNASGDLSGDLTHISTWGNNRINAIDVSNLSALTSAELGPSMTLYVNIYNCESLVYLGLRETRAKVIKISNCPVLETIDLFSTLQSNVEYLILQNLPSLAYTSIYSTKLKYLSLKGCGKNQTYGADWSFDSNQLRTIRANFNEWGRFPNARYDFFYNQLSESELLRIYNALPPNPASNCVLGVSDNPGYPNGSESIATNKGWIIQ